MRKKMFFLSLLTIAIGYYSCKKDKESPSPSPSPVTYPNYSQLKVGNYWVYQQFEIDAAGVVHPRNNTDSCYIEKDTTINGHTYFKIVKPYLSHGQYYNSNNCYSFIRDSLHYIINSFGEILFSSQDSLSVLRTFYYVWEMNDTVCQVVLKMADKNLAVVTPAGTFTTTDSKETYHMYPNHSSGGNPRYINTRYAENIGIVLETQPFYASSPNYIERRLIRYHLN
jgi:hypothetical protein